jgi:acid stress chaperone HdeB
MKKSWIAASMLAATLFVPAVSHAAAEDMKNLTCEEMLKMDDETRGILIFWMDGYLSGITDDTTFDLELLQKFAEKIGAACAKSPTSKVLETAKIVGTS